MEDGAGARRQSQPGPSVAGGELREDVVDEAVEILPTLAQGGQADADDVQSKEEVLAKAPGRDLGLELAIGRGDHTGVDGERRRAADPLETTLLEEAQQLGLQLERQLADLVEKERPAVRRLDASGLVLERAGEGIRGRGRRARFRAGARRGWCRRW